MIKPDKGSVVILTLMSGDPVIGTVTRVFSDGSFTLDRVKYIMVDEQTGAVVLDVWQVFSATETYTFPAHAIMTINTPVESLVKFYSDVDSDPNQRNLLVEAGTGSVH